LKGLISLYGQRKSRELKTETGVFTLYNGEWVLCPVCKSKTRIKIRPDTVLENFPLFCPKCKEETLINVKELHTSVIKEPDA